MRINHNLIKFIIVLIFTFLALGLCAESLSTPFLHSTLLPNNAKVQTDDSSTYSFDRLNATLSTDQQKIFDSIMNETYWSIGFLAASTASVAVAILIDPFVGGLLSLASLIGWTFSTTYMTFDYGQLNASAVQMKIKLPDSSLPQYSSLIAMAFAVGTCTAISMAYTSTYDSGTAITLAGICGATSMISGLIAIVSTFNYEKTLKTGS